MMSDCFSCLVTEGHYTLSKPLQDKCYVMTKIINRLVQLIQCASCVEDTVDDLTTTKGITKKHYDVSSSLVCYILLNYSNYFCVDTERCHYVDP